MKDLRIRESKWLPQVVTTCVEGYFVHPSASPFHSTKTLRARDPQLTPLSYDVSAEKSMISVECPAHKGHLGRPHVFAVRKPFPKNNFYMSTTDLQHCCKQMKAQRNSLYHLSSVTQSGWNSTVAEKNILCPLHHASLLYVTRHRKSSPEFSYFLDPLASVCIFADVCMQMCVCTDVCL